MAAGLGGSAGTTHFPTRTRARIALSCRTVGHWLATMLPTPTRLRRMAVSTGSSKDSRSSLQGTEIVGRHKGPDRASRPQPKEHQVWDPVDGLTVMASLKSQDSTRPLTPCAQLNAILARKSRFRVLAHSGGLLVGGSCGKPPRRGWSAAPLPAAPEALGCVWQVMRRAGARCPPHWPLCAESQAQRPEAPARPVVWGQVTAAPGCRDGGRANAPDGTHRSMPPGLPPARRGPRAPPPHSRPPRSPTSSRGIPGTSCSPRTPRRRMLSQDWARSSSTTSWHSVVTGRAHRPGAQGGGGDPVGRVSPRARAAMETQPPSARAQTLVIFWAHTGKLVICLRGSTPS